MFISCAVVLCNADLSSNWFSTDSCSCVHFYNWHFFLLVLSAGILFFGCCTLFNIYLFLVVNLPLSELRSSSRVDCLIAGINCFDTGVELDCILACFGGKVDEMRVFLFVGKISSAFGCDWSRYISVKAEVKWVWCIHGPWVILFVCFWLGW